VRVDRIERSLSLSENLAMFTGRRLRVDDRFAAIREEMLIDYCLQHAARLLGRPRRHLRLVHRGGRGIFALTEPDLSLLHAAATRSGLQPAHRPATTDSAAQLYAAAGETWADRAAPGATS